MVFFKRRHALILMIREKGFASSGISTKTTILPQKGAMCCGFLWHDDGTVSLTQFHASCQGPLGDNLVRQRMEQKNTVSWHLIVAVPSLYSLDFLQEAKALTRTTTSTTLSEPLNFKLRLRSALEERTSNEGHGKAMEDSYRDRVHWCGMDWALQGVVTWKSFVKATTIGLGVTWDTAVLQAALEVSTWRGSVRK